MCSLLCVGQVGEGRVSRLSLTIVFFHVNDGVAFSNLKKSNLILTLKYILDKKDIDITPLAFVWENWGHINGKNIN